MLVHAGGKVMALIMAAKKFARQIAALDHQEKVPSIRLHVEDFNLDRPPAFQVKIFAASLIGQYVDAERTRPHSSTGHVDTIADAQARSNLAKIVVDSLRVHDSAGSHHRRLGAVDVNRGAADIRGRLGGEKTGHIGEFLGGAEPAHRQGLFLRHSGEELVERLLRRLALVAPRPLVADDKTGHQRVDEYIIGRSFAREHLGYCHAGGANHGGRRGAWARRLGGEIEHIDNSPPAATLHSWKREPAETY